MYGSDGPGGDSGVPGGGSGGPGGDSGGPEGLIRSAVGALGVPYKDQNMFLALKQIQNPMDRHERTSPRSFLMSWIRF